MGKYYNPLLNMWEQQRQYSSSQRLRQRELLDETINNPLLQDINNKVGQPVMGEDGNIIDPVSSPRNQAKYYLEKYDSIGEDAPDFVPEEKSTIEKVGSKIFEGVFLLPNVVSNTIAGAIDTAGEGIDNVYNAVKEDGLTGLVSSVVENTFTKGLRSIGNGLASGATTISNFFKSEEEQEDVTDFMDVMQNAKDRKGLTGGAVDLVGMPIELVSKALGASDETADNISNFVLGLGTDILLSPDLNDIGKAMKYMDNFDEIDDVAKVIGSKSTEALDYARDTIKFEDFSAKFLKESPEATEDVIKTAYEKTIETQANMIKNKAIKELGGMPEFEHLGYDFLLKNKKILDREQLKGIAQDPLKKNLLKAGLTMYSPIGALNSSKFASNLFKNVNANSMADGIIKEFKDKFVGGEYGDLARAIKNNPDDALAFSNKIFADKYAKKALRDNIKIAGTKIAQFMQNDDIDPIKVTHTIEDEKLYNAVATGNMDEYIVTKIISDETYSEDTINAISQMNKDMLDTLQKEFDDKLKKLDKNEDGLSIKDLQAQKDNLTQKIAILQHTSNIKSVQFKQHIISLGVPKDVAESIPNEIFDSAYRLNEEEVIKILEDAGIKNLNNLSTKVMKSSHNVINTIRESYPDLISEFKGVKTKVDVISEFDEGNALFKEDKTLGDIGKDMAKKEDKVKKVKDLKLKANSADDEINRLYDEAIILTEETVSKIKNPADFINKKTGEFDEVAKNKYIEEMDNAIEAKLERAKSRQHYLEDVGELKDFVKKYDNADEAFKERYKPYRDALNDIDNMSTKDVSSYNYAIKKSMKKENIEDIPEYVKRTPKKVETPGEKTDFTTKLTKKEKKQNKYKNALKSLETTVEPEEFNKLKKKYPFPRQPKDFTKDASMSKLDIHKKVMKNLKEVLSIEEFDRIKKYYTLPKKLKDMSDEAYGKLIDEKVEMLSEYYRKIEDDIYHKKIDNRINEINKHINDIEAKKIFEADTDYKKNNSYRKKDVENKIPANERIDKYNAIRKRFYSLKHDNKLTPGVEAKYREITEQHILSLMDDLGIVNKGVSELLKYSPLQEKGFTSIVDSKDFKHTVFSMVLDKFPKLKRGEIEALKDALTEIINNVSEKGHDITSTTTAVFLKSFKDYMNKGTINSQAHKILKSIEEDLGLDRLLKYKEEMMPLETMADIMSAKAVYSKLSLEQSKMAIGTEAYKLATHEFGSTPNIAQVVIKSAMDSNEYLGLAYGEEILADKEAFHWFKDKKGRQSGTSKKAKLSSLYRNPIGTRTPNSVPPKLKKKVDYIGSNMFYIDKQVEKLQNMQKILDETNVLKNDRSLVGSLADFETIPKNTINKIETLLSDKKVHTATKNTLRRAVFDKFYTIRDTLLKDVGAGTSIKVKTEKGEKLISYKQYFAIAEKQLQKIMREYDYSKTERSDLISDILGVVSNVKAPYDLKVTKAWDAHKNSLAKDFVRSDKTIVDKLYNEAISSGLRISSKEQIIEALESQYALDNFNNPLYQSIKQLYVDKAHTLSDVELDIIAEYNSSIKFVDARMDNYLKRQKMLETPNYRPEFDEEFDANKIAREYNPVTNRFDTEFEKGIYEANRRLEEFSDFERVEYAGNSDLEKPTFRDINGEGVEWEDTQSVFSKQMKVLNTIAPGSDGNYIMNMHFNLGKLKEYGEYSLNTMKGYLKSKLAQTLNKNGVQTLIPIKDGDNYRYKLTKEGFVNQVRVDKMDADEVEINIVKQAVFERKTSANKDFKAFYQEDPIQESYIKKLNKRMPFIKDTLTVNKKLLEHFGVELEYGYKGIVKGVSPNTTIRQYNIINNVANFTQNITAIGTINEELYKKLSKMTNEFKDVDEGILEYVQTKANELLNGYKKNRSINVDATDEVKENMMKELDEIIESRKRFKTKAKNPIERAKSKATVDKLENLKKIVSSSKIPAEKFEPITKYLINTDGSKLYKGYNRVIELYGQQTADALYEIYHTMKKLNGEDFYKSEATKVFTEKLKATGNPLLMGNTGEMLSDTYDVLEFSTKTGNKLMIDLNRETVPDIDRYNILDNIDIYLLQDMGDAEGLQKGSKIALSERAKDETAAFLHEVGHILEEAINDKELAKKYAINFRSIVRNASNNDKRAYIELFKEITGGKDEATIKMLLKGEFTENLKIAKQNGISNLDKEYIATLYTLANYPKMSVRNNFRKLIGDKLVTDVQNTYGKVYRKAKTKPEEIPDLIKTKVDEIAVKQQALNVELQNMYGERDIALKDVKGKLEELKILSNKLEVASSNDSIEQVNSAVKENLDFYIKNNPDGKEEFERMTKEMITVEKQLQELQVKVDTSNLNTSEKEFYDYFIAEMGKIAKKEGLDIDLTYVTHQFAPEIYDNKNAREYAQKLGFDYKNIENVYSKERKMQGTINQINQRSLNEIKTKLFEDNAYRILLNRKIKHESYIYQKSMFDGLLDRTVLRPDGTVGDIRGFGMEIYRPDALENVFGTWKDTYTNANGIKEGLLNINDMALQWAERFGFEPVITKTNPLPENGSLTQDGFKRVHVNEPPTPLLKKKMREAGEIPVYVNPKIDYEAENVDYVKGFYNWVFNGKARDEGYIIVCEADKAGEKVTKNVVNGELDIANAIGQRDLTKDLSDAFDIDKKALEEFNPVKKYTILDNARVDEKTFFEGKKGRMIIVKKEAWEHTQKELAKTYKKDTSDFLKMYDKVLGIFKSMAVTTGTFHVNNSIGNVVNSYVTAGVNILNPKIFKESIDLLRGKSFKVGDYTSEEIMYMCKQTGLLDTQLETEFDTGSIYEYVKGAKNKIEKSNTPMKKLLNNVNPLSTDFALYKANMKAGGLIEEHAKLANIVHHLKSGKTLDEAIELTKKALFDYNDITDFEADVMKRIIPFYTFMSKNIPLQFDNIMNSTGKFAKIENSTNNASQNNESEEDKRFRPSYLNDDVALGNGNYMRFTTPTNELKNLTNPLKYVLKGVTPVIKTPLELVMNKQLNNDMEIGDKFSDKANYAFESMLPIMRSGSIAVDAIYNDDPKAKSKLKGILGHPLRGYDIDSAKSQAMYDYVEVLQKRYYELMRENPSLKQVEKEAELQKEALEKMKRRFKRRDNKYKPW